MLFYQIAYIYTKSKRNEMGGQKQIIQLQMWQTKPFCVFEKGVFFFHIIFLEYLQHTPLSYSFHPLHL